ncbi:MAG: hypothetical protein ABUS56_08245 [Acidobacteriota bacterium]
MKRSACVVALAMLASGAGPLLGQGTDGSSPAQTGKASAPTELADLVGNWVSIVSEDWRWRMVTPPKGDYASVPLSIEGKRAADTWDPAKDEAAGLACKSYGAAGLMRVPGRLRISWQDDNTLKVEADAGTQTRLLRFGVKEAPRGTAASWQGYSVADWQILRVGLPLPKGAKPGPPPAFGNLKTVTTHLRPGYLRKNGVPYSADTVLTEYWDLHKLPNGEQWLVVSSSVDDAKNLQEPFLTSAHFQKEPDGSKWDPTPCSAKW